LKDRAKLGWSNLIYYQAPCEGHSDISTKFRSFTVDYFKNLGYSLPEVEFEGVSAEKLLPSISAADDMKSYKGRILSKSIFVFQLELRGIRLGY